MEKDIYIDIKGDYPSGLIDAKRIKNTEYSRIFVQFYNSSHGENVKLDLFINGINDEVSKTIQWKIKCLNTGEYFDTDDYITGKNAELIIEKNFAGCSEVGFRRLSPTGSKEEQELYKKYNKPQKFLVEAASVENNITLSTQIWVFSNIEVKGDNNWLGQDSKPLSSVSENRRITIFVDKVYGLYKRNCIVKIFNGNSREIEKFNVEVINAEVLVAIPLSTELPNGRYRYSLFHSEFDEEVEFLRGKNWLKVSNYSTVSNDPQFIKEDGIISEVVVKTEEFFTQRYSSCKYESVTMNIPDGEKIVLFDEKNLEPRRIDPKRTWFYFLGQNQDKPVVIEAVNLKVKECKYKLMETQGIASEQISHENPFDTTDLELDKIKYTVEENKMKLFLSYPYTYDQLGVKKLVKRDELSYTQDYIDFFINYNPLSLKSVESSFSISTCRYHMRPTFSIVPDINWVIHFFFFNPSDEHLSERFNKSKLYFRNFSGLNIESEGIKGIEKIINFYSVYIVNQWDFVKLDSFFYLGFLKNVAKSLQELLVDVLKTYLISKMEGFKIGMHACFNYNSKGEPTSVIDYTKEFDYIRVFYILVLTLLQIGIEILLIILSRGALAERLFKTGVELNKVRKVLDKVGDVESVLQEVGIEVVYPQVGFYVGGGYQQISKDQIANTISYRIVAEPLLGIKIRDEITPGTIVKDMAGLGLGFKALRLVGVDRLLGKLKKSSKLTKKTKSNLEYVESGDFSDGLVKLEGEIVKRLDSAISNMLGVKAKITMTANIFYDLFAEIKIDIEKETIEPVGKNHLSSKNNTITYGPKSTLGVRFEFDATIKNRIMMGLINTYVLDKKKQNDQLEMIGEIEMGMIFEREYSYETLKDFQKSLLTQGITVVDLKLKKQLVYQDKFIFTGAYGYFDSMLSTSEEDSKAFKNQKKSEFKKDKKPFEIFPPFTQILNKEGVLPDKLKKITKTI